MKHSTVFSLCNQKGGVGKTTTAVNIATGISQRGYKVLLIDIDPQANATSGLGKEKTSESPTIYEVIIDGIPLGDTIKETGIPNLSLIPSNADLGGAEIELVTLLGREFRLKKALEPVRDDFDYIFLDCPPSLGLLTVNSLSACDLLFIPLQCEYYALEGLSQLIQTFSLIKQNLNSNLEIGAVLLTMADLRTKLTEQVIYEVRSHFKDKVFETVIPRSVSLGEAPSFGKPGILYQPSSKGAKSYQAAVDEFLEKFPKRTKRQIEPEAKSLEKESLVKEGIAE